MLVATDLCRTGTFSKARERADSASDLPAQAGSLRHCASHLPKRRYRRAMKQFFAPASIALIGATEADPSVGRTILNNLASFKGPIYPINPKRDSVLGRKAYPRTRPDPLVLAHGRHQPKSFAGRNRAIAGAQHFLARLRRPAEFRPRNRISDSPQSLRTASPGTGRSRSEEHTS